MARYVWNRDEVRWVPAKRPTPARRLQIVNRDAAFADGVASMADGKPYTSRRAYDEHLKAHGMVEIGNEHVRRTAWEPPSALPALRRGSNGG